MVIVKYNYSDHELNAMNIDDFLDTIGEKEIVYQRVNAAHKDYLAGVNNRISWDDYIAENGME